jgi:hypothetical protein
VRSNTTRWEALAAQMPAVLRDAIGTEPWQVPPDELEEGVEEVPLTTLEWALELPVWGWRGRPFQVTPNQVRADPRRYAVHYARTMWSELDDPIVLARRNGRWVVLDGYHRLLKAFVEGRRTIRARKRKGPG